MNKKYFIIFGVALAIAAAGFFGYNIFTTPAVPPIKLYAGKITIGYTTWPGYLGLYIAQDKGYFKDAGLNVDVKGYTILDQQYSDYIAGKAQGAAMIALDAVNEAYGGLDHKIVAAIDYSNGSDGIVAGPKIKTFADVKGKRVGFDFGTLEEFFLRYALSQNQIDFKNIIPVNLGPQKSVDALLKGDVDIAVTYEPFMSKALAGTSNRKIYSSADAPGLITDVLSFHTDFIKQYPDTVQAIVGAYFRGVQFWKDHPAEANAIVARYLGTASNDAALQIKGATILDKEDNRINFTFSLGLQSLYRNLRSTSDFVQANREKNIGTTTIDTDTLIDPDFIRTIAQ